MKRNWLTNLIVAGIVGLLTLFLVLQYNWLSEASTAERDRMRRGVEAETKAFADEFNREIQAAFFNFQTSPASWNDNDATEFNERYDYWRSKTAYPDLVRDIYYLPLDDAAPAKRFDAVNRTITAADAKAELSEIRGRLKSKSTRTVYDDINVLTMPIFDTEKRIDRILIREEAGGIKTTASPPEPEGHLIVMLDRNVITSRMLPELAAKHFGEGDFVLAVSDRGGNSIWGRAAAQGEPDASAGLLDMRPDNLIFFANRELTLPRAQQHGQTGVVVNQRIESHTFQKTEAASTEKGGTFTIEMKGKGDEKPRTTVLATSTTEGGSPWTVRVDHKSGSIETYISGEKLKSFAVGLGIYLLLVGSIVAIVFSAQRSRRFAQRQIDFVSSVSHEFRTPLAVIYSAGENLADGVAKDDGQVSRYGELIKNEGKKLSGMVEQILEFAGARSGKRRYSFAATSVRAVIDDAIAECTSLIEDRQVDVETSIPETLPEINADKPALIQALQNLIANSVKYGNGEKWVRISAVNGGGMVKITVEDRGIGISAADLKQIFEPFYRAKDVVDAQIHGNGLGLSLVKEIAEAHGGSVHAESEVGKGSRFTIELPTNKTS